MGLYGNIISHIPRSHFDIVKVFPNQKALSGAINDGNINVGDYVLIDYELGGGFSNNLTIDDNINYHNTVWQKGFRTTTWTPPNGHGIWDVPQEEQLIPPQPTFFAIARLYSVLAEKSVSNRIAEDGDSGEEQALNTHVLMPVPINQIPEVITLPDEFNSFGSTSILLEENDNSAGSFSIENENDESKLESIQSITDRVFNKYGTRTYSYLTH